MPSVFGKVLCVCVQSSRKMILNLDLVPVMSLCRVLAVYWSNTITIYVKLTCTCWLIIKKYYKRDAQCGHFQIYVYISGLWVCLIYTFILTSVCRTWYIMCFHYRNGCKWVCKCCYNNHRAPVRSTVLSVWPGSWRLRHRIFRVPDTCHIPGWPTRCQQTPLAWLGRASHGDWIPGIYGSALRRRSVPRSHTSLQYLPNCYRCFHWHGVY